SVLALEFQHALHYARYPLPVLGFALKLFRAVFCDGVESRPAVVLACAPFGGDASLLLQTQECGIHGSFVQVEHAGAHLLDAPRDSEAVEGPQCKKGSQDHQVQGSLQYFRLSFVHSRSFGHCKEASTNSFAMSIGVRARDDAARSATRRSDQELALLEE